MLGRGTWQLEPEPLQKWALCEHICRFEYHRLPAAIPQKDLRSCQVDKL